MELTEHSVRDLVEQVLRGLEGRLGATGGAARGTPPTAAAPLEAGVFPDIESAVSAARRGHEELVAATLETRRSLIAAMRRAALDSLEPMARAAVDETGMGRITDKVVKNRVA